MTPSPGAKLVDTVTSASRLGVFALGILLIGILLRLLHLDADPDYYEWIGYVTDEGRWVAHARDLALHGRLTYEWLLHLHLAPLFQAVQYVVFVVLGVSIWSARIVTAIAGSLLLVAFWRTFRRTATAEALVLGMTLLALETDLVVMSRLAIPEMIVMALEFFVFVALVAQPSRVRRSALAGVILLVAVGMKATALPMTAVFFLVCLSLPRAASERRLAHAAAFVGGFAIPAALIGLAGIVASPKSTAVVSLTVQTVRTFVLGAAAYDSVSFVFESPLAPVFGLWGLALWIALLGFLATARRAADLDNPDRQLRRVLVGALVWICAYAAVMLGLDYFPSRYKVHILVPMAIAITAGLSLFQRAGFAAAEERLHRRHGIAGWAFSAALALPAAVLVAPLLVNVLGLARTGHVPVRVRIAAIVVTSLLLTLVLHRWRHVRASTTVAVLWPVLSVLGWTLARRTGLTSVSFWPTHDAAAHLITWTSGVIVAAALAVAVTSVLRRAPAQAIGRATVAAAFAYVVLSAFRVGPAVAAPTYTIRDASHALETDLVGVPDVLTTRGDGLFNENRIRYQAMRFSTTYRPDAWITVFAMPPGIARILETEYCLVKTYPVSISKEYLREQRSKDRETITHARLWMRQSSGRCAPAATPTTSPATAPAVR